LGTDLDWGQKTVVLFWGTPCTRRTGHVILRMRSELCSLHNEINAMFRK